MNIVPDFIRCRVAHRPALLRVLDNISWLVFDKILRMGAGLLIGVWVARYLGPEDFGLFSYAQALVSLAGVFATLGLQGIVVRDIVRIPNYSQLILGTTAVLQLAAGFISYLILIGLVFYIYPSNSTLKCVVAILGGAILFKSSEVVVYWFESQIQAKYIVWVQNSVFLVFAFIKVLCIYFEASIVVFACLSFFEVMVSAVALWVVYNFQVSKISNLRVGFLRAKKLISESWPLLISGVVLVMQAQVDQILLGHMVGLKEVGYYSVALRLIEVVATGSVILYSSFFPLIVAARNVSEHLYGDRLVKFYRLNMVVSIGMALPIAIFSPWLIKLLFGEEYEPAALIMSLMSARLILAYVGVVRGVFLLNEGLVRYSALTMLLGVVINIALCYMLIPHYGGVGAVVASLVSFFLVTFVFDLFYSKARKNSRLMLRAVSGMAFSRGSSG